jgi:hypothetical protein
MTERLAINVTSDQQRGYIATHPELRAQVVALSLGGLRRKIDAMLVGEKEVDVRLTLDRAARVERDARRDAGANRQGHMWAR